MSNIVLVNKPTDEERKRAKETRPRRWRWGAGGGRGGGCAAPQPRAATRPGRHGEQRKSPDQTLKGSPILNRGVRLGAFIVQQTS